MITLITRTEISTHDFCMRPGIHFDKILISRGLRIQADEILLILADEIDSAWNFEKVSADGARGDRIDISKDRRGNWIFTRTIPVLSADRMQAERTVTKTESDLPYHWLGQGALPTPRGRGFARPRW